MLHPAEVPCSNKKPGQETAAPEVLGSLSNLDQGLASLDCTIPLRRDFFHGYLVHLRFWQMLIGPSKEILSAARQHLT